MAAFTWHQRGSRFAIHLWRTIFTIWLKKKKKKARQFTMHPVAALCVWVLADPSSTAPQRSLLEPRDQLHNEVAVHAPSSSHLQRSQLWQESCPAVLLANMLQDWRACKLNRQRYKKLHCADKKAYAKWLSWVSCSVLCKTVAEDSLQSGHKCWKNCEKLGITPESGKPWLPNKWGKMGKIYNLKTVILLITILQMKR